MLIASSILLAAFGSFGYERAIAAADTHADRDTAARPLRRETAMALENCTEALFATGLPLTKRYIQALATRIMTAPLNRTAFSSDLDPAHICIGLDFGARGSGFANSQTRSVGIGAGLILSVQNDAQLAAVIGHELAHVTMRHAYLDAVMVAEPERERMQRLTQEMRLAHARIESSAKPDRDRPEEVAAFDALQAHERGLFEQIHAATVRHIGSEAANNWEENEADEVGLELYLNAGFPAEEVAWRHQQISISQAAGEVVALDISPAERMRRGYSGCGVQDPVVFPEPARGAGRYPEVCWTIWRLLHSHPARPSARMVMTPAASPLTDPTLAAVKEEIRRLKPAPAVK